MISRLPEVKVPKFVSSDVVAPELVLLFGKVAVVSVARSMTWTSTLRLEVLARASVTV